MSKVKGSPKTGGRKRGTPNKTTALLRDMILQALANKGGTVYLEQLATAEPKAFTTLLAKVLPLQIMQAAAAAIVPQPMLNVFGKQDDPAIQAALAALVIPDIHGDDEDDADAH